MNLVTATAASSLISTFLVGYFANLPLALAPGLGALGSVRRRMRARVLGLVAAA